LSTVRPQHDDTWSRARTVHDLAVDEIRSVLQKSIRRGDVEEAVLAALELYDTGPEVEELLWRRLEIIAAEDVGMGRIDAPVLIEALNSQRLRIPHTPDRWIFAAHAVRLLCESAKDRTSCDLAGWATSVVERGERMVEIQDFHVDHHTRRGIELGRGPNFWLEQGGGVLKDDVAVESKWGDYVRARTRADAVDAAPAANGAVV
jgi:replication-associated recombination protein RarA